MNVEVDEQRLPQKSIIAPFRNLRNLREKFLAPSAICGT
jgi:hypothetical protein